MSIKNDVSRVINTDYLGATGQFAFMTLWEGVCGHTGPWAIELTSEETNYKVLFGVNDQSSAPGRYQMFWTRSLPSDQATGLDGKFYVPNGGQYSYKAFVWNQRIDGDSAYPPDYEDLGEEAERGTWYIRREGEPIMTYQGNTNNYIPQYKG